MSESTPPIVTKVPKHRASRACERCRARKVRCDIVQKVYRCNNCTLDGVECKELPPRRRKRGTGRSVKHAMRPIQVSTSILEGQHPEAPTEEHAFPHIEPAPSRSASLSAAGVEPTDGVMEPAGRGESDDADAMRPADGHPLPDSNEDLFPDFITDLVKNGPDASTAQPAPGRAVRQGLLDPSEKQLSRNWQRLLPPFAALIRSQRAYRYHEFLHLKGAFDVPTPKLQHAILTRYVEFVHPQLPCVDMHHVLQAVATSGKDAKVSILLFQAIMLAGSSYVDAQYIFEAGYPCRMALRQELAERVRLLYDFDCEGDRLDLLQSLILMTSWQRAGDEIRHLRHWLSIAFNIALLLGLNKDPSALSIPAKQKHLRRRVWWSLYMRDRTLSLGLRQVSIIPAECCELPELVADDFDLRAPSTAVAAMLENCALLRDLDQQTRLCEVFRAQLSLSHHLASILQSRYMAVTPKLGTTRLIALVLVPKAADTDAPAVQECSERLDQWFRDLPDHLRFRTPLSLYFHPGQDLLIVHCGILNLFYYALVCALHRPYPSPILRELAASEVCAQRKARHAATAISSILREFQDQDLICFLPTQGITFMLQAAVTHLCDSTSKISHLRDQSHRHLESCLEILNTLKDVHSYAPFATNFLTSAAAKLYRQSRAIDKSEAAAAPAGSTAPDAGAEHMYGPRAALQPETVSSQDTPPLSISNRLAQDDWSAIVSQQAGLPALDDYGAGDPALAILDDYPQWADPYVDYDNINLNPGWEFFLDINEL